VTPELILARVSRRPVRILISACAVAIVTFVTYRVFPVNMTTAGFVYLLLVLVIASTWGFAESGVTSVLASLAYDFFFVPPVPAFGADKTEDWIALFSFLATSLIVSRLSATIKRRTSEAVSAEQSLRQAQADLAHVNRMTTMGELTASLAHEVNQPIAAAITDAHTCLRWLKPDDPNVQEAQDAASRILKDANRAADIVSRIRLLFKKGIAQQELVDVNEVIQEMFVLLRNEANRYSIYVRSDCASDLPKIMADRVQLQQVFMNLILNAIDAMKAVNSGRELTIKSERRGDNDVLISVSDTGTGLPAEQADQIFNAFFTTKPQGTGMGLRISRSIVESHGGRLWAENNSPRGASFHFTLSSKGEAHE
jgi:C4-dicarboxylate-specific signal transduction histidine kinase